MRVTSCRGCWSFDLCVLTECLSLLHPLLSTTWAPSMFPFFFISQFSFVSRPCLTYPPQFPVFPPQLRINNSSHALLLSEVSREICWLIRCHFAFAIQVCWASSVRHGISGGRLVNAYSTNFCAFSRSGMYFCETRLFFLLVCDCLVFLYEKMVNISQFLVVKSW